MVGDGIHSSNADPEIDHETPIEVVFRHFEGKRVIWLASELAILMNSRSQSQLKSPILLSIYWLAYSYVFQLLGWNGLPASRFGLMYCSLFFFLLPSPLHAAPKSEEVAGRKLVWRSLWWGWLGGRSSKCVRPASCCPNSDDLSTPGIGIKFFLMVVWNLNRQSHPIDLLLVGKPFSLIILSFAYLFHQAIVVKPVSWFFSVFVCSVCFCWPYFNSSP